ncbi:MAG: cob(I)yrinic acid a,c-diamide adenosyltransferase [Gammaproteobacteria bacterium]
MGHRLTRIYTRTGDQGTTGLADGSRVAKDDLRIEVIGDVDELNCCIGMLPSTSIPDDIGNLLETIQNRLFDIGAELSQPNVNIINVEMVTELEAALDVHNETLSPLKNFILPGGGEPASLCHLSRAICRRAERHLVCLSHKATVNQQTLIYLNRLSDLLFVIARILCRQSGNEEKLWKPHTSENRD